MDLRKLLNVPYFSRIPFEISKERIFELTFQHPITKSFFLTVNMNPCESYRCNIPENFTEGFVKDLPKRSSQIMRDVPSRKLFQSQAFVNDYIQVIRDNSSNIVKIICTGNDFTLDEWNNHADALHLLFCKNYESLYQDLSNPKLKFNCLTDLYNHFFILRSEGNPLGEWYTTLFNRIEKTIQTNDLCYLFGLGDEK